MRWLEVIYHGFDLKQPQNLIVCNFDALGCTLLHRVLVQMEGTAHIDFPKFETAKAINFKILPVMHM